MSEDDTLRERTLGEQLRDLITGELTTTEAATLLGERDLWTVPGVRFVPVRTDREGGRTALCAVDKPAALLAWVRLHRPALGDALEAAIALEQLRQDELHGQIRDHLADVLRKLAR